MVVIEVLLGLGHGVMIFPGFRDQHHQGMGWTVAGLDEEFYGVVQTGCVRKTFGDDRQELFDIAWFVEV